MSLLADYNLPFAAALVLMLLLAVVQVLGFGDFGIDADADPDLDSSDSLGAVDGLLSMIGLNRLPLNMWLALFLLIFAAIGVSAQALAMRLIGGPLDAVLAAAIAAASGLPVTGLFARPLAAILPKDETSAVSTDALVGRRATISIGRAAAGSPARAVVYDRFGQMHNVMVEPHDSSGLLREGDVVLLVRRDGDTFFGVGLEDQRLAPVG